MKIKPLDWDSNFFKKKIGLLDLSYDSDFSEIQNDFDLIYVLSVKDIAIEITNYKPSYSENKIVFSKKIVQKNESTDVNNFFGLKDLTKKEI